MPRLQVKQAIHGYREGHQLIAASIELARNDAATMQIMSDLSGPAFQQGFDSYLTAYPLSGAYCIAKTWYAPELRRPGCVWTHSLIVDFSDLPRIFDAASLLPHFMRPSRDDDFERYSRDLQLDDTPIVSHAVSIDDRAAGSILRYLYGSGERLVIPSDSASRYESVLLAIFSQQWPRLRRSFRFCTGALSLKDSDFDVSVSPSTVTHGVSDGSVVVDFARQQGLPDRWLEEAVLDLQHPQSAKGLRGHLWRYGSQINEGRAAFAPLAEVYASLKADPDFCDPGHLLASIAHFFPEPNAAALLKADVFGSGNIMRPPEAEHRITEALLVHPMAGAISAATAAMAERAEHLAELDFQRAGDLALIALSVDGPHSAAYASGYTHYCMSHPNRMGDVPVDYLQRVLEQEPYLAEQPEFWRQAVNKQMSLVPFVWRRTDLDFGKVVSAMAGAGADAALRYALSSFGELALAAILKGADAAATETVTMPTSLRPLLDGQTLYLTNLVQSGELGGRSLLVVASAIDARSHRVRRLGANAWLPAINYALDDKNADLRARLLFLSAAMNSSESGSVTLLVNSFPVVFRAVAAGAVSDQAWWTLEADLPYSYASYRTERLVRGIAQVAEHREWPLETFGEIFTSVPGLDSAVDELSLSWSGRRYLKSLRRQAERFPGAANQDVITALFA